MVMFLNIHFYLELCYGAECEERRGGGAEIYKISATLQMQEAIIKLGWVAVGVYMYNHASVLVN